VNDGISWNNTNALVFGSKGDAVNLMSIAQFVNTITTTTEKFVYSSISISRNPIGYNILKLLHTFTYYSELFKKTGTSVKTSEIQIRIITPTIKGSDITTASDKSQFIEVRFGNISSDKRTMLNTIIVPESNTSYVIQSDSEGQNWTLTTKSFVNIY
jgi:hypothetical protein